MKYNCKTPKELLKYGNRYGFENIGNHGVHPHLIDPNFNKLLPIEYYLKSISMDPNDANTHFNLGNSYKSNADFFNAIKYYKMV